MMRSMTAAVARGGSGAAGGAGGAGADSVFAVAGDDAVFVQPDDGRVGVSAGFLGDPNGDSERHGGCRCVGGGEHDREYCGLLRAVGVWVPAYADGVAGERVCGDDGELGSVGGADANDPGAASEGAGCGHRGGGYLRRRLCLKTSIFSRLFWAERRVFGQEPEFLGKVRLWGQVPDLLGKNAEFRDFGSKSANLSRVTTT